MRPSTPKTAHQLTGWRLSTFRPMLPRRSAASSAAPGSEKALAQLLATRSSVWSAGRYGLLMGRALVALGVLALAAGMAHSSVGGLASFGAGLTAGCALAGSAAAWRQGLKKYVWRRTAAFRTAYERLHLAGKADAAIAHRFVCDKEFGRAVALQQVLGGKDTRLGWRLRASAREHEHDSSSKIRH